MTITPVYTNPSTNNSHNSNESSAISYSNTTTSSSSSRNSLSQSSVSIFGSKGKSADKQMSISNGGNHQLINGGNGLLITALPDGGSVSNGHNAATNGIHSYTNKGKNGFFNQRALA